MTAHFLKIIDGEAFCDYVAFCSKSECAHSTAAMHLEGMLNISEELQRIQNDRLPGRPKLYKPMAGSIAMPRREPKEARVPAPSAVKDEL